MRISEIAPSILAGSNVRHPIVPAIDVNWLTHASACVLSSQPPQGLILGMGAIQVTSSRKEAKSRTHGRKSRTSTLRAQPQEVRGAPGPGSPVGHD